MLRLELNSKTAIELVKNGVTFVGYRIFPGYRKMKKRMQYIAKKCQVGLIDFDAANAKIQSYFGLMRHCAARGLQKWIEQNIVFKG